MTRHRFSIFILITLFSLIYSHSSALTEDEIFKLFNPPEHSKYNMFPKSADYNPYYSYRFHKNGLLWTTINNNGIVGNFFGVSDPEIGRTGPAYYFPRYSRYRHGFNTALWVGGIIESDTLVSVSLDVDYQGWWTRWNTEFWPEEFPEGDFREIVNDLGTAFNSTDYRSQVIYEATYVDTFQFEDFVPFSTIDQRYHKPLDIKVTQESYSWSYKYAEDFIIVNYKIRNLGFKTINDAFIGLYHIGANHLTGELPYPILDDIEGYIDSIDYEFPELGKEPMNISWTCDVNGNPTGPNWSLWSTPNVMGIAPLNLTPNQNIRNFNWWVDVPGGTWGPRQKGTIEKPLRLFRGQLGAPLGDANKYYMMSFPEVDYSGYKAAINQEPWGWMPPHEEWKENITEGHYVHYLTSYGPYTIEPGKSINLTVAYAVGEDIHTYGGAYADFFDLYSPQEFLNYLNFENLTTNIRWAKRIYDNPGVDTDMDGDSGKAFTYFDSVTQESLRIFYEGDGVPDFKGASPPPPPPIRVKTEDGKITIRWNGKDVENFFDTFTLIRDFEGYRVYVARSKNPQDIVLQTSYDREDYSRWLWNNRRKRYELKETPFTIDSLQTLYGDNFQPLLFNRYTPYNDGVNLMYFTKVDYNNDYLLNPNEIHKIYPDATRDTSDVDEEGRMRYYEYEYVIEDLLPSVPYYVSVTAFDFGYPAKSLGALESSPYENLVKVYALDQSHEDVLTEDQKLDVYVYPNPYIDDLRYRREGYENRFDDLHFDRSRRIYFANLPNKCTIKIFSLDGDLIKELHHDEPIGSGTQSVAEFDLISRNTQALESGLYYFTVESALGNQVGKFVIIR